MSVAKRFIENEIAYVGLLLKVELKTVTWLLEVQRCKGGYQTRRAGTEFRGNKGILISKGQQECLL